jgi:hypothetical protein
MFFHVPLPWPLTSFRYRHVRRFSLGTVIVKTKEKAAKIFRRIGDGEAPASPVTAGRHAWRLLYLLDP